MGHTQIEPSENEKTQQGDGRPTEEDPSGRHRGQPIKTRVCQDLSLLHLSPDPFQTTIFTQFGLSSGAHPSCQRKPLKVALLLPLVHHTPQGYQPQLSPHASRGNVLDFRARLTSEHDLPLW